MSVISNYVSHSVERWSPVAGRAGLAALDYGTHAASILKQAFEAIGSVKPGPSQVIPLLTLAPPPLSFKPPENAPAAEEDKPYTPGDLARAIAAEAADRAMEKRETLGDAVLLGRTRDLLPFDDADVYGDMPVLQGAKKDAARPVYKTALDSKRFERLRCHL